MESILPLPNVSSSQNKTLQAGDILVNNATRSVKTGSAPAVIVRENVANFSLNLPPEARITFKKFVNVKCPQRPLYEEKVCLMRASLS